MSRTKTGNPYRTGEVVVAPPGKSLPPETGFTPIWEEELGLLYVSNIVATTVDLSVGKAIRFNSREVVMPSKRKVNIAYNITNV
jgi:hypothetical protein